MQKVFVDTVAWIALVNLHDSLHNRAKDVLAQLRTDGCRFLTSEFVLVEFAKRVVFARFPPPSLGFHRWRKMSK